jgi:hypothetical protein
MVKVNSRVLEAPQQLIKVIAAQTARLIEQGAPILNLSQGSPNLPMFEAAHDAAVAELATRRLPYTDVPGRVEVRQACADFLNHIVLGIGAEKAGGDGAGGGDGGSDGSDAATGDSVDGPRAPRVGPYGPEHICITNGAVQVRLLRR